MNKKEKIKARLRALFPKANLSTKRMDDISAKLEKRIADDADDEAIDLVLNEANDLMDFAAIAKEDDRIRTLEKNQKQKEEEPPADPPADPPTPPADDTPAWAKALIEQNKTFADELAAIKNGKITETKQAQAQKLFDASEVLKGLSSDIRSSWANRIDVNSETPLEDQVKFLEAEFSAIQQSLVQNSRFAGPAPTGQPVNGPSDEEVKSIVDSLIS